MNGDAETNGGLSVGDLAVAELFDGVSGVPSSTTYGVDYGNPELLRQRQGDADEAFGRAMMNYRSEVMVGGARNRRHRHKHTYRRKRTHRRTRKTKTHRRH